MPLYSLKQSQNTKPSSLPAVWDFERRGLTGVASVAGQIYFAGGTATAISHLDEAL